ncbi:MAG TPA: hypothetical protein VKA46_31035 [Gemmataceae bacterium]|nr:hypothetical protein [Gemmataceae bacterium]
MPLTFLLDEHLRGVLWQAIQNRNALGGPFTDVVCVGDPPDLPLGSADPDLLLWAERAGRILITRDARTMPRHFRHHLQAGHHSPGLLLIVPSSSLQALVAALELIAHAGDPANYLDQIDYIP